MSVITRYLISLFFRHLGWCVVGFLSMYLVADFIEKISEFLSHDIPILSIIAYFSSQIPNVLIFVIPVGALTSLLITLVILARNSEIVAFKGSGVSLWRLSWPFLGAGLFLCVVVFLLGTTVTPYTSTTANNIWEGLVRNRRPDKTLVEVQDVWTRDVRLLAHFDVYNEESTEAQGATFILLDEFLNLFQRIDAENAKFSPAGVLLTNAEIKDYTGLSGQEEKSFTLKRENELFIPDFPTPPPGLGQQEEVPSEELSIQALQANISRLKSEGFYPVRQIVDLHFKISRSFITLIMIIVGLPIGFWREKGGSVALGLVPGLTLSFIYLVSLELSRTVGYAGFLPPFLAAWLPNGFFLLLGLYLFTYVRQ